MEQSKMIAVGIIILLVGVVALQVIKGKEPKTINPAFSEGGKQTYKNPKAEIGENTTGTGENTTGEGLGSQGTSSAPGYI